MYSLFVNTLWLSNSCYGEFYVKVSINIILGLGDRESWFGPSALGRVLQHGVSEMKTKQKVNLSGSYFKSILHIP